MLGEPDAGLGEHADLQQSSGVVHTDADERGVRGGIDRRGDGDDEPVKVRSG